MYSGLRNLWILPALLTVGSVFAQPQDVPDDETVDSAAAAVNARVKMAVDLPQFYQGMYAAEDGHYLAQTEEELQTYYDLAMSYEYIESDQIRHLLQLDDGEGIIIENVQSGGAGKRVGFQAGDLVLRVGEEPVVTQYELVGALTKHRGNPVPTRIRRDGQDFQIDVQLEPVFIQNPSRWILGVSVEEMSELLQSHLDFYGAVITDVTADGPAEKMGLRVHDIIVKIDGRAVGNLDDVRSAIQESGGQTVTVEVVRAGNRMTIEVNPTEQTVMTATFMEYRLQAPTAVLRGVTFEPVTRQFVWDVTQPVEGALTSESGDEPESDIQLVLERLEQLQQQVQQLADEMDK